MTAAEATDFHARVVEVKKSIDRVQRELEALKADLDRAQLTQAELALKVKKVHHDHQGTRQMAMNLLDELDHLVPSDSKGKKT